MFSSKELDKADVSEKKSSPAKSGSSSVAGVVLLESDWVEQELGDGFGKILQTSRLVPASKEGKFLGFKVFSITPGSLLEKVGLKNSDIITQVNDQILDAENGFALFQAFMDEREINIHTLRNNSSSVVRVQIK